MIFSDEVSTQLADGIGLENVEVKVRLSILKPIHAGCLVDFYNHMTTSKVEGIILSAWRASGLTDTIRLELKNLPSIDPFDEIDPMIATSPGEDEMLPAIRNFSTAKLTRNIKGESDDDSEWECEGEEAGHPLRDFDVYYV